METIERVFEETQEKYEKEYLTERLGVVTKEEDIKNEDCKRPERVNVMKYPVVKHKQEMLSKGYEEHCKMTYKKYVKTIQPRRFRNAEQVYAFAERINKTAGRTLEKAEMMLLLRAVANGRRYDLVCIVDITDELDGVTKWER